MKLYSELKQLDRRELYFDPDSIIYVSTGNPTDYEPKLGEFLGDWSWTDEIDPEVGNYIDEFISAGPKNYAYKTDLGNKKCTIKGFTLNHITSLTLNFNKIKEVVTQNQSEKVKVIQQKFTCNKKTWQIKSEVTDKLYGFVYDKRILHNDFSTLPYGYQNW